MDELVGQARDIIRSAMEYGRYYVPVCGEVAMGNTLLL
jgi:hypothetical protein